MRRERYWFGVALACAAAAALVLLGCRGVGHEASAVEAPAKPTQSEVLHSAVQACLDAKGKSTTTVGPSALRGKTWKVVA